MDGYKYKVLENKYGHTVCRASKGKPWPCAYDCEGTLVTFGEALDKCEAVRVAKTFEPDAWHPDWAKF